MARARTLPNSRVHSVAIRLVSLQSVVRSTRARAFSAGHRHTHSGATSGKPKLLQVVALALAHGRGAGLVLVVVAAEVQQAVDDVQGQLRLHVVAALRRLGQGDLGADDQFAGQALARSAR